MRVFPFVVAAILLANMAYVAVAADYELKTFQIDLEPYGDYDEVVNRAGGEDINYDTWENVPSGVYAGSYIKESEFQFRQIMKYWYEHDYYYNASNENIIDKETYESRYGGKVILAQYVKYTADIIMSGSSVMYVRLPINASSFECGAFYIYHVSDMNNFRIAKYSIKTFDEGEHDLFYHTKRYIHSYGQKFWDGRYTPNAPGDMIADIWFNTSSTALSNSFPYVRNYRVYVPVTTPIKPDEYYLFVTVAYAKSTINGGKTSIFLTPDNISTAAIKSFIGIATDESKYELQHSEQWLNVSLGYSVIFNQGYGASVSAMQYQFYAGDEIHYTVNTSNINQVGKYVSIMFPFINSGNESINLTITIRDENDNEQSKYVDGIDFALVSFDSAISTNSSWYDVIIKFNEDAKLGLILTEPNYFYEFSNFLNATMEMFSDSINITINDTWYHIHSTFFIKTASNKIKRFFFALYAPVEFGDGKWNYVVPSNSAKHKISFWQKFLNFMFCGMVGMVVATAGITPVGMLISSIMAPSHNPFEIARAGVEIALYQNWDRLYEIISHGMALLKNAFDLAAKVLDAIGNFVKKVAYAIKTAISWVIQKITHYGGVILQAVAEIIYLVVFIAAVYLWYKFLHWMRLIALARWKALTADIEKTTGRIRGIFRR